jgi:hypothetical protein
LCAAKCLQQALSVPRGAEEVRCFDQSSQLGGGDECDVITVTATDDHLFAIVSHFIEQ